MTVTIPSDLIIDVMRNATPSRAEATRARLAAADAGSVKQETSFNGTLNGISPVAMTDEYAVSPADNVRDAQSNGQGRIWPQTSPQQAFEQMLLHNMFEAILPAADSGIYGEEGASSGIWRSLAAEQLAATYTKAGGLGIADTLDRTSRSSEPVNRSQWPYFEQSVISGFAA